MVSEEKLTVEGRRLLLVLGVGGGPGGCSQQVFLLQDVPCAWAIQAAALQVASAGGPPPPLWRETSWLQDPA